MKPVIVAWLHARGLPGFLAPDYATMCGIAAIAGAIIALRLAERDGEKLHVQARAMLLAYVAALLGGYVFEWIRAVPDALAEGSLDPLLESGRAAYGGLLASIAAPSLYLGWRARRGDDVSVRAFLDRATPAMGIAFALVRTGCFLEGCDYGKPTAGLLGVRFPVGSLGRAGPFRARVRGEPRAEPTRPRDRALPRPPSASPRRSSPGGGCARIAGSTRGRPSSCGSSPTRRDGSPSRCSAVTPIAGSIWA